MSEQSYHEMARATLNANNNEFDYYRLSHLEESGLCTLSKLPFSVKVLLENVLRNVDGYLVTEDHVLNVAKWDPLAESHSEIPFMPARVLMQDFTGVPAVVDLAAMREAIEKRGGDPRSVNPVVPVDLVIDHSLQVDNFGNSEAVQQNVSREFQRNRERYMFLRWAQNSFRNFRVVPPGTGIVHQVNLEHLANVITEAETPVGMEMFPDTVVGTDSHTTMINGLGVVGWGVGGIEAEAVLLGQPYYMQLPQVVGFKFSGSLRDGVTATDLVLTVTQMLRHKGVVGKFVEFFGPGLSNLSLADRATISNMAPEYGATCGLFPIDYITLEYMRITGRDPLKVDLVEKYAKEQGLFRTDDTPDPVYSDLLEIDIGSVVPSIAGPRRPQDKLSLGNVKTDFYSNFENQIGLADMSNDIDSMRPKRKNISVESTKQTNQIAGVNIPLESGMVNVGHGMVVIAAITSCTNTSNPSAMIGAGLLSKKAVERGLKSKPWVKTSMAPGSQVVTDYISEANLDLYLESLGFHTVGYGCTTCIGNSGPLLAPISEGIQNHKLVVASVLSGNRNFEGRIHPEVKANYLASPMIVVAYALAGTVDIQLDKDPLGFDESGNPVYLSDVWPSQKEISDTVSRCVNAEMFKKRYDDVFVGSKEWRELPAPEGDLYQWDKKSTYIQEAPFFQNMTMDIQEPCDIEGARVLVMLEDFVTTDHISPAGSIPKDRPAGQYLMDNGVRAREFNTFGARRGNHEVMMRGTFANVRLRNRLIREKEGDWTVFHPDKKSSSIFMAANKYLKDDIPTIIIAGKEYGAGSSRDWAAKGPSLLGIRATLVESYERIHRNNLVGMGILPLQFKEGENADILCLTGSETFDITGLSGGLYPGQDVLLHVTNENGNEMDFTAVLRLDSEVEVDYYLNGGVLNTVLRKMLRKI